MDDEQLQKEFEQRTTGEAAGITEARDLVVQVFAAQGVILRPFEVTPRAVEIAEEYGLEQWKAGIDQAAAGPWYTADN